MKILSLTYRNKKTGWNVKDLSMNALTLLVGASGVGKTQILRAIMDLSNIVRGKSSNGIEWSVSFKQNGISYQWEGAFTTMAEGPADLMHRNAPVPVEYERVFRINGKKDVLIERNSEELRLNGKTTVKLEPEKSAISLLREEADIAPIYKGFRQIYSVKNQNSGVRISPLHVTEDTIIRDADVVRRLPNLTTVEQLFLLYKHNLSEFDDVKQRFIDIFPFVEDVSFTMARLFDDTSFPMLLIKEKGVEEWISQDCISSGMFSTLSHLTTLTLAYDGDVILVDEFENSLGVNCIEDVAEMVLHPERDLQFVITSHHPYVINNIDYSRWKIVTRRGSDVTVHTADELHLGEHSKHDAFMQLIQTEAYKTGRL